MDYQYDYEDRLTRAADGAKITTYAYDGDGNLIAKTFPDGTNTDSYEYFYDYSAGFSRLLVEKKNGVASNYLYAGRLFARKDAGGTVYYHQDGLGSITAITNAAGVVQNKYKYDVYGTPKAVQETVENCILFTGEMYDAGSGLYYLRARYYNPGTGSFMTPDTEFGEMDNPLSQNLYIYCLNNPVLYTDPSGHRCVLGIDTDVIAQYWDNLDDWFKAKLEDAKIHAIKGSAVATAVVMTYGSDIVLDIVSKGNITKGSGKAGYKFGANTIGAAERPMFGSNGVKVTSKTVWERNGMRLDVENPNPGQRPGQIHFQDSEGNKYLYDPDNATFTGAPNWVNDMLKNNNFVKGMNKGLEKYLGEWGIK